MPGAAGRSQPIMSPKLRLISYLVLGAALGIEIGINLSNESYGLAVLILLIASWMVTIRASPTPPDAWLLTIALVGYIVGNRGFAQLQPSPMLPLLPAEGVLAVAIPMLLARVALKKATAWRKDALNYSVIIWMLIGAIRLPLDIRRYGVLALRDLPRCIMRHFSSSPRHSAASQSSSRLLTAGDHDRFRLPPPRRRQHPDFTRLPHRQFHLAGHSDHLPEERPDRHVPGGRVLWLWTGWTEVRVAASGFWLRASSLLLIGLMASPRAGMFAVAVTTVLWLVTGQLAGSPPARLASSRRPQSSSVAATAFLGRDLKTSVPYSMYEQRSRSSTRRGPARTSTAKAAIRGQQPVPPHMVARRGGGHHLRDPCWASASAADLSSRFLADYDLLGDETFAARSPHSLLVTVIGRMGFVGLAAWIAVSVSIAALVWRLLKSRDPDGMGLASVVAVVWLSACFGVVLEGPMGAVIFWTALGLANARMCQVAAKAPIPTEVDRAEGTSEHWPVAKAGALDTQAATREPPPTRRQLQRLQDNDPRAVGPLDADWP